MITLSFFLLFEKNEDTRYMSDVVSKYLKSRRYYLSEFTVPFYWKSIIYFPIYNHERKLTVDKMEDILYNQNKVKAVITNNTGSLVTESTKNSSV